jgi:hypothetical protein
MPDDGELRELEPDVEPSDYGRAADDYHAERQRLGKQLMANPSELLEQLTRDPISLRDRVGLTVRWGVSRQLVHFGADGLAHAHQEFEQVDPKVRAEFERDVCEGLDPGSEEYAEVDVEWHYKMHGEPLFATHQEQRAFMDLAYALQTGYGQSVALQAREELLEHLGATSDDELADLQYIADDSEVEVARWLLPIVGLIAEERVSRDIGPVPKTRKVPKSAYEEFHPIAVDWLQRMHGTKQPLWIHELVEQFEQPLRGESAEEAVTQVLRGLSNSPEDAPDVFTRALTPKETQLAKWTREQVAETKEHLRAAEACVRSMRVDWPKPDEDLEDWFPPHVHFLPEYVPDRVRRGPAAKPWRAAALFARCFGVIIPDRERDAMRRK